MSFFSTAFLIFIGVLFAVYFLAAKILPKYQWCVLLAASIFFYADSDPKYLVFLFISIAATWLFPLLMEKKAGRFKGICLALCLLVNIGLLIVLKYHNFFLRMFDRSVDWFLLPLGISYYTFQSTGYCIDVYRGGVCPERNFLKYALYVSFFPQISQGPIGTYQDLAPQFFKPHSFEYVRFISGLERLTLGFFKKIVVANNLAPFVNHIYQDYTNYTGFTIFTITILYGIQLYTDFSGYMDIALGISECLGITLTENFQTPYFSKSISEFWRRWHMSLGAWFKDYLYYPILRSSIIIKLGKFFKKNGFKKLSKYVSTTIGLLITWVVIGFWHGAAWKFVAYGLYHGSFIIANVWLRNLYKKAKNFLFIHEKSKLWALFQIIRTYLIVNLGYVLFRAGSLRTALSMYHIIFTKFFNCGFTATMANYGKANWILMSIALLFLLFVEWKEKYCQFSVWLNKKPIFIKWPILYFMIAFVMLYLFNQQANAMNFIYFDF